MICFYSKDWGWYKASFIHQGTLITAFGASFGEALGRCYQKVIENK